MMDIYNRCNRDAFVVLPKYLGLGQPVHKPGPCMKGQGV